ncbi:MAG: hypothetical protein Q9191_000295 [Dirinaria sp. TL-2023a]
MSAKLPDGFYDACLNDQTIMETRTITYTSIQEGRPPAPFYSRNGGNSSAQTRFAHIRDLQAKAEAANRDLGAHTPLRTLLNRAQQSAAQASSLVGFKQPDRAYVEHLASSDILLNIIPRHRDYPYMSSGNGDWHRSYALTCKQVDGQHSMFMEIYNMITEDNARSGVRPSNFVSNRKSMLNNHNESLDPSNRVSRPLSMPDGPVNPHNGSDELFLDQHHSAEPRAANSSASANGKTISQRTISADERSVVHAMPEAPRRSRGAQTVERDSAPPNLAQRFSQLRFQGRDPPRLAANGSATGPVASSVQVIMPLPADYTLSSPESSPSSASYQTSTSTNGSASSRPSGPRNMPPTSRTPPHPPKIPLDPNQAVVLPRAPSPAYDPAKSTLLNGQNPPNAHRRRNPDSLGTTPQYVVGDPSTQARSLNGTDYIQRPSDSDRALRLVKPESGDASPASTITVAQLYEELRSSSVLLIDVRNREDFDQGHIFAKSIMCIEPLGLKSGISAEELEDRLVLSTQSEQTLFERRNEFDLVVYYDQETTSDRFLNGPPTSSDASALRAVHDCLYEFNYYKQLRRRPVLLLGGLEAWVDLVGSQGLAPSHTAAQMGSVQAQLAAKKPGRPIGRVPMASANSSLEVRRRRLREHHPLNADEEKSWLEKARREEIPSADYSHAQSDSDAESSNSQPEEPPSPFVHSYNEFLRKFPEPSGMRQSMMTSVRLLPPPPPTRMAPSMPSVPSRPPPAVPRPSYSGVSEREALHSSPTSRQSSAQLPLYTPRAVSYNRKLPRTGLVNFSVTCYMNATIQCLMATLPLSHFFLDDRWHGYIQKNWKGSNGVMPEIFANLIRSLWKSDTQSIRPSSLRNLCARLNREWGVDRQQDAKEFFDFLLDCLHEDLNFNWNKTPLNPLTFEQEITRERMPVSQASSIEWQRYTHREQSFIADLFAGQHASRLRCTTCKNTSTTYEAFYSISVEIPRKGRGDIYDCLHSYCQEEKLSGDEVWKCPYCKCEREATKKITITRAPQILVIHLKRFSASKSETARKVHTPINFPLHQLNIGPYMSPPPPLNSKEALIVSDKGEQACTPPYVYDCYAVMRHLGSTLSSGHYIALVKDGNRGCWRKFDDQQSSDFDPAKLRPEQKLQNEQAYLLFYGRAQAR